MLQSCVLPGTSTHRAMQEDERLPEMTETSHSSACATSPRRLNTRWRGIRAVAAAALVCAALAGCTGEQFQKGYILPAGALEQIPIGASQDQVLIVMGTPSTDFRRRRNSHKCSRSRSKRPLTVSGTPKSR